MTDSSKTPPAPAPNAPETVAPETPAAKPPAPATPVQPAVEVGGRKGPEPTRYGDWEKKGIAVDF